MKRNRKLVLASALLGAALLAGCAAPSVQVAPEDAVRLRAKARWDALIAGEFEKAYQFLQPSYRPLRDFDSYRRTVAGGLSKWTGADVVGVECAAEACTARIRIDYQVPAMMRGATLNTHYDEKWVSEKGNWWLYERP